MVDNKEDRGDDVQDDQTDDNDVDGDEDETDKPLFDDDDKKEDDVEDDDKEDENDDKSDDDVEDDDEKKKDDGLIPRSRYNQKNKQYQEAMDTISQLNNRLSQLETTEKKQVDDTQAALLKDLQVERKTAIRAHTKAVEDGADPEVVADAMTKVLDLHDQIRGAKSEKPKDNTAQIVSLAKDEIKWEAELERVYQEYPVLDDANDDYDEDLVRDVLSLQEGFISSGQTKADSLRRAVRVVAMENELKPAGTNKSSKKVTLSGEQKVRNAKRASKKAPNISDSGDTGDETTLKIEDLSDEEFRALPSSKQKELRGDVI